MNAPKLEKQRKLRIRSRRRKRVKKEERKRRRKGERRAGSMEEGKGRTLPTTQNNNLYHFNILVYFIRVFASVCIKIC